MNSDDYLLFMFVLNPIISNLDKQEFYSFMIVFYTCMKHPNTIHTTSSAINISFSHWYDMIACCYQDTMATEANWWEQNNNGQGSSSLNPGINEETIRPDWVDYMEDYDMDDFLIPEQNGNTDHAEGRPPNRGKRFTNEQLDIFKR